MTDRTSLATAGALLLLGFDFVVAAFIGHRTVMLIAGVLLLAVVAVEIGSRTRGGWA